MIFRRRNVVGIWSAGLDQHDHWTTKLNNVLTCIHVCVGGFTGPVLGLVADRGHTSQGQFAILRRGAIRMVDRNGATCSGRGFFKIQEYTKTNVVPPSIHRENSKYQSKLRLHRKQLRVAHGHGSYEAARAEQQAQLQQISRTTGEPVSKRRRMPGDDPHQM
jgi:hypothetical protein